MGGALDVERLSKAREVITELARIALAAERIATAAEAVAVAFQVKARPPSQPAGVTLEDEDAEEIPG